jgi:hypothetical protein
MALNLTAVGTLVSFVVANRAPKELLLVVPVVAPTLGLLWLDHHINIHRIAAYVRTDLWAWEPSWEQHLLDRPMPRWWAAVYWVANFLVFFGASASSLVIGWPGAHGSAGLWLLWLAGASLTILYAGAFAYAVLGGRWR